MTNDIPQSGSELNVPPSRIHLITLFPGVGFVLALISCGIAAYVHSRLEAQGVCSAGLAYTELRTYGMYVAGSLLGISVLARFIVLRIAIEASHKRETLFANLMIDALFYASYAGILYVGIAFFLLLFLTHVVLAAIFATILGFSAHFFHSHAALHRTVSGLDGFLVMTTAGTIVLIMNATCGL